MIAVVYYKSLLFYPRESEIFFECGRSARCAAYNEDLPALLAKISLDLREISLNQLGNTNRHLYKILITSDAAPANVA
ncbi:hypothetical protein FOZ60_003696 [Perkinsus olseni]|uniref:Uncharacterized protein n=1 Tax=Perkinsus olseni TaxID=32597 RepID=A0A7J6PHL5_PEROL|nr:hypothetical protein FOZ60_003696 [Perkinsus olseni]